MPFASDGGYRFYSYGDACLFADLRRGLRWSQRASSFSGVPRQEPQRLQAGYRQLALWAGQYLKYYYAVSGNWRIWLLKPNMSARREGAKDCGYACSPPRKSFPSSPETIATAAVDKTSFNPSQPERRDGAEIPKHTHMPGGNHSRLALFRKASRVRAKLPPVHEKRRARLIIFSARAGW